MLQNTQSTYGSVSKLFHWGIFLLVVIMLVVGFIMEDLPDSMQSTVYMMHKSTGLLILGLMVLRLLWRWMNKSPEFPNAMPQWQKIAAHVAHWLFYIILLAMPLVGWIMSTAAGRVPTFYGLITAPFPGIELNDQLAHQLANVHEMLAYVLLFLLALHIAAALKHHFIDKDNVLVRMMPRK